MSYYFPPQKKPQRWGTPQDIEFAVAKNSEKIYGVDHKSNGLVMPLFFGFPCLDYSGKQNHGTPYGGVAYNGQGLDFDGGDDAVSLGDITFLDGASVWTISSYINIGTVEAASILAKWMDAPTSQWSFLQSLSATGEVGLAHRNSAAVTSYGTTTDASLQVNTPYNIVWVGNSDINNYKLYVNGVQKTFSVTGRNVGVINNSTNHLFLGSRGSTVPLSYYFNGLISEARINNITLTAEQIALFYARPWDLYRRVGRTYYSIAAVPSIYIPQIMIF